VPNLREFAWTYFDVFSISTKSNPHTEAIMRCASFLLVLGWVGCFFDRDGSQPMNASPFSSREQKAYPASDHETASWRALGHDRDTSDLRND
jgi:hypothetical protein